MKRVRAPWQLRHKMAAALVVWGLAAASVAFAVPVPGGTVDPTSIPKYVTPLVIPPVMPASVTSPAPAANYDISVRQFKQQILPGGIWGSAFPNPLGTVPANVGPFPATNVWGYGRASDPQPDSSLIVGGAVGVAPAANSTFNYPSFTIEATSNTPTTVRWMNELVADPVACAASVNKSIAACNFLPHLLPVDQTLHWANPTATGCVMPMTAEMTDCHTNNPLPYTGPVPIITHVHGAHVGPESDGFPEGWWLPGKPGTHAIPATYAQHGSSFTQADTSNTVEGSAYFRYPNSQPATTIWYHDHALGMTRTNVVAGPAGFWLIRGGANDTAAGVLPGPAPVLGVDPNLNAAQRNTIREIPLAIQDRAFDWADALGNTLPTATGATQTKIYYPTSRSAFDGFTGPYLGGALPSDMSPIWNPEVFFNTMVVNGTTWPKFDVAPARYRLRLLDGCTARSLNLSMFVVTAGLDGKWGTADDVKTATELPFYQIGGDQGFLPKVVKITKGFTTTLPGNGTIPAAVAAPSTEQGLLLAPAERADVIVDFGGLANGTHVRLFNTAPDMPFQGFPAGLVGYMPADPLTSGQVMEFVVNTALPAQPSDTASTLPQNLVLPAEAALPAAAGTIRKVSLNEMESDQVCVEVDPLTGAIARTIFSTIPGDLNFRTSCALSAVLTAGNVPVPMAPRQALLGNLSANGLVAQPKMWSDPMTELPAMNGTETWEIFNTTVDAHPIHVHLVRFQVVNRQAMVPGTLAPDPTVGMTTLPAPNEAGYKDTVIAYPGQITRLKAQFTIPGRYVWHCHIVDHEDNEMMRVYKVMAPSKLAAFNAGSWYLDVNGNKAWDATPTDRFSFFGVAGDIPVAGEFNGNGYTQIGVYSSTTSTWYIDQNGNGAWDGPAIDRSYWFGVAGGVPVTGNWTGIGFTKLGVYDPVTFKWYLDQNGNGAWDAMDLMNPMPVCGAAGVVPVTGDWNGDGRSKVGYYDPATFTWHVDYNGDGVCNTALDKTYFFGFAGAKPVPGDWGATGTTALAVYDPITAMWYMDKNGNGLWDGAVVDANATFGLATATPLVGNW